MKVQGLEYRGNGFRVKKATWTPQVCGIRVLVTIPRDVCHCLLTFAKQMKLGNEGLRLRGYGD